MDNKLSPYLKPPLTYYGGKQSIISHILPLIPPHDVYTEAYFGGGTVFWAKTPAKNETINDRLDLVVTFYKVLKNNYKSLKKRIDSTLVSRYDKTKAEQIIRNRKKYSKIDLAWAAWFTFNFSFNNKPFSGLKYSNAIGTCVPDQLKNKKERFTEHLVQRIEHATIENREAIFILKSRNVHNAFHEIDPPYLHADQGHYKGFKENDLIDLLDFLEKECKGKFILHNYNSDILSDYTYRNNWNKKEIKLRLVAPRKSGEIRNEVMVFNFNQQPYLFEKTQLFL